MSETKPMGLAALMQRQPLKFVSTGQVTREGLRPRISKARRRGRGAAGHGGIRLAERSSSRSSTTARSNRSRLPPGRRTGCRSCTSSCSCRSKRMRQLEFPMTNGRKLDRYRYRVTADVEIDTGDRAREDAAPGKTAGARTIPSPKSGCRRSTRILPVKMLIVEKDGMRFEQVIQSLELRD